MWILHLLLLLLGGWWHHFHHFPLPVPRWPIRPPLPGSFCTPGGVCTG